MINNDKQKEEMIVVPTKDGNVLGIANSDYLKIAKTVKYWHGYLQNDKLLHRENRIYCVSIEVPQVHIPIRKVAKESIERIDKIKENIKSSAILSIGDGWVDIAAGVIESRLGYHDFISLA